MKLHYTKYKENYKRFILSTIKTDINDKPITKYSDKVNYLLEICLFDLLKLKFIIVSFHQFI